MGAILSFFERRAIGEEIYTKREFYNAINNNNLKKVKKLLPLIDVYNIHACVLYHAYFHSSLEVYYYLYKTLDIDKINNKTGETLWMSPMASGFLDDNEMTQILSNSKNINTKNTEGHTILHRVLEMFRYHMDVEEIQEKCTKTIKLLIEYGADPYIETYISGRSVSSIDLALKHSINILEILLDNKFNKYVKISTLNYAVELIKSNLYDIIELLLPHIEDINELDELGHSVLWNAKKHMPNETDIIELLEVHGARE